MTTGAARSWTTDIYERALAGGSVVRGRAQWGEVPVLVWLHLLTVGIAVALTPTLHPVVAFAVVVTGALLIAGFFTFPFHRLLGTWLFG